MGDGYIDGTASFGETDVGDVEVFDQIGHRLRLGELVEGLTGQSKLRFEAWNTPRKSRSAV